MWGHPAVVSLMVVPTYCVAPKFTHVGRNMLKVSNHNAFSKQCISIYYFKTKQYAQLHAMCGKLVCATTEVVLLALPSLC